MSEVRLPAPVRAVADRTTEEGHMAEEPHRPGGFSVQPKPEGDGRAFWGWIRFWCPCGCGSFSRLPIGRGVKPARGVDAGGIAATWEWDGDRERPSLSPSINHIGHWHGYLTRGWFRQPEQAAPE